MNVASELSGTPAISMEQIYEWNPDVIIITTFSQTMPEDLYNNTVPGQDWSNVKAVREGRVYKEPIGVYRWFPPSGDAPLMLKWMSESAVPGSVRLRHGSRDQGVLQRVLFLRYI